VVDPQGYPRFLVGPPDAAHIHHIPADEHRGGESGQKIPIDVPLHGSVSRPKVMAGGRDFHVFHDFDPADRPDITAPRGLLLNELVGAGEQDRRDLKPERRSSLQVDHELELVRLLNRQLRRLQHVRPFSPDGPSDRMGKSHMQSSWTGRPRLWSRTSGSRLCGEMIRTSEAEH
jgi:hypothetical protein